MTNIYEKNIILIALVVLVAMWPCKALANGNRIYYHPGETQPVTVEAAIGADFNITCYMNPKAFPRKTSSSLYFVNGRTNVVLPRENIVITNSSTIVYMVRNASEQQTEYRCKCGTDAIMETKVFVGTPPRPGKNFTCHSYDFDHMICNFTKPPNPILTTYNVSYYNDMPNYIFQPHCNYDDRSLVVCNTSLKDRYQEFYNFIIESSNALVDPNGPPLTQYFAINNFEVMIPSKPGEHMRVDSVTVDGIRLAWLMPNWEKYRAKGLQWEVLVQPENATLLHGDPPVRDHNELRLRLNNLPYAYWRYELKLRVRVKHPSAVWSEQLVFPFRTAARRPQRPPRIQPGSFYIDPNEKFVTLFWEELQPFENNGDNFTYVIRSVRRDGDLTDLKPSRLEINLAVFSWQIDSQYEFEIGSRNHMGDSLDASRLMIYPLNKLNVKHYTPKDINNVYHDNNRTYTLTWSKPRNRVGLMNYTVYWCYPKRALPNECKESMHFQQVPANQLNFTTKKQDALEERTLNLAVSANYERFNTGLHWTACTNDVNVELTKIDPELTAAMASIKVQWRVERVCTSILLGFNLTYCEVDDDVPAENATCVQPPITITLQKHEKIYNISNLKPFTMYKVSMYMFKHNNQNGKSSDPQLMRTLEGAPSPPRHLKVFNVTNTSASIKWMEPSHRNGKIRKYIIMLNNDKFEVNATTLEYPLVKLESFTSYKVYVLAQTVDTSDTSNDVHFTTAIGYPSPPGHTSSSNNASIIQWSKPTKPNGRLEFYEVSVTQMRNEEVTRRRESIIMGGETACAFQVPICIGAEYQTIVEVRAVNAASLTHEVPDDLLYQYTEDYSDNYSYHVEDNSDLICEGGRQTKENMEEIKRYFNSSQYRLYKSPWQTSAIYSCSTSRLSKITTIALVVVAMSLGVMAALYMARKKYNKMANINCTLPAGLETYFTKDSNGFAGDFGGVGTHPKSFDTRAAEDQWISAARMHEFNFRNEHHHLLASLGNDSGYLGGGGVDAVNGHTFSSSLETANVTDDGGGEQREDTEEEEEDYEKDNLKTSNVSSSADSLVESTDESGESATHSDVELQEPLTIFPNDNGYIKQSMIQPWQNFQEINEIENKPQTANNNGYISVQSLDMAAIKANTMQPLPPTPQTSGYVLQQDLQNFFTNTLAQQQPPSVPINANISANDNLPPYSSGYTTLDDLSKLNLNTAITPSHQTQDENNQPQDITNNVPAEGSSSTLPIGGGMVKNPTAGGLISGYVTQHDLNLFAQHQQHQ